MSIDFIASARNAGRTGIEWMDWTFSDEVQNAANADLLPDTAALEAAHTEGLNERRVAEEGWKSLWTTAPEDYDCFGTSTVEHLGDWHGKQLRRAIVHPHHAEYQACRYGSGLHPTWDEDPRVEEERARLRAEEARACEREREERRAAGLVWLKGATDAELDDYEIAYAHHVTATEARAELRLREEAAASKLRAERWARCRATFEDGATLIDDGSDGDYFNGRRYKGRDSHVWHGVRVEPHYSRKDDADEATVVGEGNDVVACLAYVADWLASGRLRLPREGEHVPPRPVVERVGQSRLKEIRRVVCSGGRAVWVGRPLFGEVLVLDDRGHLVRSKTLVQEAIAAV